MTTRTPDEQAALAWLYGRVANIDGALHRTTLMAMIGRPTMPQEPSVAATNDAISALGFSISPSEKTFAIEAIRLYHNHLYRRLTAPKTKTVWSVGHESKDGKTGGMGGDGDDLTGALETARALVKAGYVVTITPHEVEA